MFLQSSRSTLSLVVCLVACITTTSNIRLVSAQSSSSSFECQNDSDCQNNGQCILMQTQRHYCQCPHGYGGVDCSQECDHTCDNGGSCRFRQMGDVVRTYCECPPHQFMGTKCEIPFRECPGRQDIKCFHGGSCERTSTGYKCNCPLDRTGAFCQLEASPQEQEQNEEKLASSSSSSSSSTTTTISSTTSNTSNSNNNSSNSGEENSVQLAFLFLVVALVGAAVVTGLSMCFCKRYQPPIDTHNEAEITAEAVAAESAAATNRELC